MEHHLSQYIKDYNEQRPHMSCTHGYPSQVHDGLTELVKHWEQRKQTYTPEESRLRVTHKIVNLNQD